MGDEEFLNKLRRLTTGLTDKEVAQIIGTAVPTVSRWRTGKNLPYRLARALVISALEMRSI